MAVHRKSSASCRRASDSSNMAPQPDVIVAVRIDPAREAIGVGFGFQALARLKPGVTPAGRKRRHSADAADLARRVADDRARA